MATTDRQELTYYRVAIGTLAVGHVDNKTVEEYMAGGSTPSSKANSLNKEYANLRFKKIMEQISEKISPIYIINVVRSSTDVNVSLTQFDFTVVYDRDEYLETRTVTGEPESVGTLLTGTAAVKRWIERALNKDATENRLIYDPTVDTSAVRNGPQFVSVTALAGSAGYPVAAVTVSAISNTLPTV